MTSRRVLPVLQEMGAALFGFIVAKLLHKMNERHFIIFLFFIAVPSSTCLRVRVCPCVCVTREYVCTSGTGTMATTSSLVCEIQPCSPVHMSPLNTLVLVIIPLQPLACAGNITPCGVSRQVPLLLLLLQLCARVCVRVSVCSLAVCDFLSGI